ncbi:MAG TPA: hypothetical protein P5320_02605 [Bacteroidales bacterium]|nr:hypothetical protein [Bacteroidales bacterium]HOK74362.1 hypothetical protein [Bacteroidales bacterium]HOM41048.1 hypothetical protein [Bacteroidales bacterium]HPP92102.1 hypothetical protein [Bacteroidales bacterium]HQK70019.1 hypothetical protein [Bacteroidales bacterium]
MKINKIHLILVSCFVGLFVSGEASGIPAFARKYQISCQVCHSPVPRLKPYGEEFAASGYRMTEYESPRYFINTGDDKLSLLREVPLAVRVDGIASYNRGNSGKFDFGAPSGVKLLSGGELSDKLSYYFYFFMSEGGEIVGIEDAFLTYSNLFGTGINITAGQFQACDPFYKREIRLTLEDIAILTSVPGTCNASLKYERGIMADYEIPKLGTGVVVELINGNGIGNGGEELLFDKDKYKNLLLYISQPLGRSFTIGLMGYLGKEIVSGAPVTLTSNIKMIGPVIKANFNEHFIINAQYILRTDARIFDETLGTWGTGIDTQGGYLEAIFTPRGDASKWYFTGLLNWVESDYDMLDYKSATFHIGHVLRRNVRLISEYSYIDEPGDKYGKFSVGFVAAF